MSITAAGAGAPGTANPRSVPPSTRHQSRRGHKQDLGRRRRLPQKRDRSRGATPKVTAAAEAAGGAEEHGRPPRRGPQEAPTTEKGGRADNRSVAGPHRAPQRGRAAAGARDEERRPWTIARTTYGDKNGHGKHYSPGGARRVPPRGAGCGNYLTRARSRPQEGHSGREDNKKRHKRKGTKFRSGTEPQPRKRLMRP